MKRPAPRSTSALQEWRLRLNGGVPIVAGWAARQPAFRAIVVLWGRLLDEACALVAPAISPMLRDDRLVAVPREGTGFELHRVTRAGAVRVSMPEPGTEKVRKRVELRLRADQVLERSLSLPGASRDYLPTIIDHRLDRLAPWRRDRVVHGYALTGDTDGGATLQVRVAIASADLVQTLTESLRASGLEPVDIATGADHPASRPPIRFGGEQVPRRPAWQARFGRIWLAGTVGLCGLAVGSMVWTTAADSRRVEAERHLTKARRLVREASEDGTAAADPAFADKRPETATVLLIDKLATALPDTTYLRELALTPREVRLAGTSADAPALIPLLEKAGLFDVRFSAPVARGDDRKDAFEITADRAPPAPDAP